LRFAPGIVMKSVPTLLLASLFVAAPAVLALEWKERHLTIAVPPLKNTAETEFEFTNTSQRPVTITGIDTSCDCLEVTPSARTLAPGATGTLRAHFSFGDRTGVIQRMILVSTDDGESPARLTVELTVPEVAKLTPRVLDWPRGGEAGEKVVLLEVAEGVELTVERVQGTSDAFRSRLETVEAGRRYRLHVEPADVAKPANAAFRFFARASTGQEVVLSAYANVR
jgi:hypothetical protein